MTNPYNDVRANLQRSEALVARHSNPKKVNSAKREILDRIDDQSLRILVYGAYNSGKSTLVNALLGEARAPTGGIPTTNRVDCYDWEGYQLIDTPGVNAPIEHEKITAEILKQSATVLLVVREGDQDTRDVYDRLCKMMRDKKEVFVVLNHEARHADEVGVMINRTFDMLVRSGRQHGIEDRRLLSVGIFPVNLYTAWNGRSRRQAQLTEHSGFTRFLNAFYDWTKNLDHETHHLDEVKGMVKSLWYAPALDECGRRRESLSRDDEKLEQLRNTESAFVARRNELRREASHVVAREIAGIRPEIVSLLRESTNESERHEGLMRIVEVVIAAVNQWLQDEVGTSSTVMATGSTTSLGGMEMDARGSGAGSGGVGLVSEAASAMECLSADTKIIKDALLALRGTKALGIRDLLALKGKWHTTLGRYAGNIGRVLKVGSWVLNAAMAVYSAKRAHDEQENQNRKMIEAVTVLHKVAEDVAGDLRRELLSEVERIIDHEADEWLNAVRSEIDEIRQNASEQEKSCQQLADYQSQLEEIHF